MAYWGCLPSPPTALAVGTVFPLHILSLSAVPTADGTVSLRGVLSSTPSLGPFHMEPRCSLSPMGVPGQAF